MKREHGGGNEVCQEASAFLPVGPLVDCSIKGKHVLNNRAEHPVVLEESAKLQVTRKHRERASKLPNGGQAGTT